ncbi:hypothetical protein [Pyrobaculum aerophilum]|uniref:Uncharacterized protein n=2 Tax=Pyrobaculum aerophilum TaxID=13773 RepID=Q8ZX59_PYRAE|nr:MULTISPECIES: hypothetical protein [Pyrobaculum]AAL63490.1 hypothetical protein PAE1445 [Pyrobaculum aerophilum str. IM2]MCX8135958.1 hypothetical protein [Pyrobaculum aerophilum]HII46364.1 hypothetical protein [Pyrobaculum aerophilum]
MRLRAPFLRMVLQNSYMELELGDIVIFAEAKRRGLYAEIYMGDVGYIYEKGMWYAYDGEGRPKIITATEAERLRKLAKKLSTLPKYHVLEQLIKALASVEPRAQQ